MRIIYFVLIVLCLILLSVCRVSAFYEFQSFIEEKSKKQLNCAFCHKHVNGPDGNEPGQLGSLTEEQKKLTVYNQYLVGSSTYTDSPILNKFGNHLVMVLTYDGLVEAQGDPQILVDKMRNSDLDKDGISDGDETLDGTLPYDPLDGSPWKLFVSNLKKKWLELCFQAIAIFLLAFSLTKLSKA